MYYLSSENTGADQLRGYREADLRLCFRIGNYPVFSRGGSNIISKIFDMTLTMYENGPCTLLNEVKKVYNTV